MKYTYAYKTSDGIRHEAAIDAVSREEAFSLLRGKGIRPIKVVAADGSVANGEVRGVRKRIVAAVAASVALAVGALAYWGGSHLSATRADGGASVSVSSPRHQIYGDPAIVAEFNAGNFSGVLSREGDRLLAIFAQPGRILLPKGVNFQRPPVQWFAVLEAFANEELKASQDLTINTGDPREVAELKQIVNGIREEMRDYLANGKGSVRSFWRRLIERSAQEAQIFERTRKELENEVSEEVWEQKNEALRRLGLRSIPNVHDSN